MKFFYRLILFSCVLFSCSGKDKLPSDVLPASRMKEVMWDMVRAGQYLDDIVFKNDSTIDRAAESEKWFNKIYSLHKITKTQFEKSYAYYESHPAKLRAILDSLSGKMVRERPVAPVSQANASPLDSIRKRKESTFRRGVLQRSIVDSVRKARVKKDSLPR
jgi:hypothetical protein